MLHCCCFSPSDINCGLAGKSPSHLLEIQLENHFLSEMEGKTKILNAWTRTSRASFSKVKQHLISTVSTVQKPPQGTWSPDWQGRQSARELTEPGSLNFKEPALAMCHKSQAYPKKQKSRRLNFEVLITSGHGQVREHWGKQGGHTECISQQNFIMAITQFHFRECF